MSRGWIRPLRGYPLGDGAAIESVITPFQLPIGESTSSLAADWLKAVLIEPPRPLPHTIG